MSQYPPRFDANATDFPFGLIEGVISLQLPDVSRVKSSFPGIYANRCAYTFSSMDKIITLLCSSTGKVGVVAGVEEISMVGETVGKTGEGLVYCSQPTNASAMKMIITIRLHTVPERCVLDMVTFLV